MLFEKILNNTHILLLKKNQPTIMLLFHSTPDFVLFFPRHSKKDLLESTLFPEWAQHLQLYFTNLLKKRFKMEISSEFIHHNGKIAYGDRTDQDARVNRSHTNRFLYSVPQNFEFWKTFTHKCKFKLLIRINICPLYLWIIYILNLRKYIYRKKPPIIIIIITHIKHFLKKNCWKMLILFKN